jgi:hypothetical protein
VSKVGTTIYGWIIHYIRCCKQKVAIYARL